MKVAVLGLGAMGSAALAHLAARGVDVVGFEQFEPGHDRGSSHGWSRVIRKAYFEHSAYVPLLTRAFELWEELDATATNDVVHFNGVLILGPPDSSPIRRSRESAEAHGVETELLSNEQLRARFPQFVVPADTIALFEPGGGFAIPEHGNAEQLRRARKDGAEIVRTRVNGLRADSSGVVIETDAGAFEFDHVVVAAGPWTGHLLPSLAAELVPQAKTLAWFESPIHAGDPTWMLDSGSPDGVYYGVPPWEGQSGPGGAKVGFHGPGPLIEPGVREAASRERLETFASDMRGFRPDLGEITASATCTYTMTPDEHFVLGPVGDRVTVAAGFSGHGYKFAPVIGEVLADFAMGREPAYDLSFLSPARFGG